MRSEVGYSSMNSAAKKGVYTAAALTAIYWLWESRAEGNIRVDLLLIYPVLIAAYLKSFWPRFRFYSILITLGLMALNFCFFVISYDLFNKSPG